jgi:hypothetical protein
MRSGTAALPLHGGKAPPWLFTRMVKLAEAIIQVMINEHGHKILLQRISDPFWFQALGCVLGFDWHSSGVTTVTCGALKQAVNPQEHGLAIAGGKGGVSRKTPGQIMQFGEIFNLSSLKLDHLKYCSRITAKVDSAAIQDNHQLYHHVFIFEERGSWAVIQQGLDPVNRYARRYHWLDDKVTDFLYEPHDAIMGDSKIDHVLDMTAENSGKSRKVTVDLVNDNPNKLKKYILKPAPSHQPTLDSWLPCSGFSVHEKKLKMPWNINWSKLSEAYEVQPRNFEELISQPGIGPSTVRALALIGELVYGAEPSWRDPVKYSFTVGGKDGVPYPVDRKVMDETTQIIKQGVNEARIGNREKLEALNRLRCFVPDDAKC